MTNQEIVNEARRILYDEERSGCFSPEDIGMISAALGIARITLRAQEEAEKNEPLTLDELRQMDGEKIHIRYVNHCKTFYNDEIAPYYGKDEQYIQRYNGMLRACDLPLKYYGEEWLAYRHKPKEGVENA